MPASPLDNAEGPVRVIVTSGGADVSEALRLVSVTVQRTLNRVPTATLVLSDGDMPDQDFPLSDAETFKPGAEIVIKAGYDSEEKVIFSGVAIKHSLSIRGENDARLVVECRDKAVKMTIGRKSTVHVDKTDSQVFSTLIGAAGLSADVTATSHQHKGLVQHYCSDWDFMLARAEANACVVSVVDGKVTVGPPRTNGSAVLAVGYGDTLMEFQADLDARHQYAAVKAQAWDMKSQAVVTSSEVKPQVLGAQGNIDGPKLAKVSSPALVGLQTGALWPKDTLESWAKAQQLKSGLSRLRGSMRFQGSALAQVNAMIELKGVGTRFSGTVYITGVRHQIEDGTWTTEAEFGAPIEWFAERNDLQAPAASGLVPAISGLHAGVVMKLDSDPAGEHRVQVKVPSAGLDSGIWARLLQFHASNGFGAFFLPEIGDEVLLGWFNNDPDFPVVLGSLYSSQRTPPYALAAANNTKAIVTRSKCKLEIDDEKKIVTLLTPGNNKVVISDEGKSIELLDQNGNKVRLTPEGITLDSPKNVVIKAGGTMELSSIGAMTLKSTQDVKVSGLNVGCEALVGFTGKGSATAELSAAGLTTVKGAMVMIN
ncbi:MAG: type VI secretion system tip protein VgrG [Leptothrix sp. (in: b-proteobacteria)]